MVLEAVRLTLLAGHMRMGHRHSSDKCDVDTGECAVLHMWSLLQWLEGGFLSTVLSESIWCQLRVEVSALQCLPSP